METDSSPCGVPLSWFRTTSWVSSPLPVRPASTLAAFSLGSSTRRATVPSGRKNSTWEVTEFRVRVAP